MSFANRIAQALHEEHNATVALMERLDRLIALHRRGEPPSTDDGGTAELLRDLSASLETEVQRHFAFEEERLFPYLAAAGNQAIGAHLAAEHAVMRPVGASIAALARAASARGFDHATWNEFRRSGQELCERLLAHVQKEEMALLPLIEDGMDAETEVRLAEEYLATT